MTDIFVNSIVEWRNEDLVIVGIERVLWISGDRSQVYAIDIRNVKNLPILRTYDEIIEAIESGYANKLSVDPYSNFANPSKEMNDKHSKIRDRAWQVIHEIVELEPDIYDPRERGLRIAQVCTQYGVSKKVVYGYLKRYWVRGKFPNALLPEFHKCGAPGGEHTSRSGVKLGRPRDVCRIEPNLAGVNVTQDDKKKIRLAISKWYNTTDKNSLAFVYNEMKSELYRIGVYFKDGVTMPILPPDEQIISFTQFCYWAKKELNLKESLEKRVGERKYALNHRPLPGNATRRAFGPGSTFEIDATVADVCLVSKLDRNRIIGRPVVYIVKDVFSRMVCGVYVGLEGPSWIGAMMALENATTEKVTFCKEYGITITNQDWPCHFLPKTITADRGEMESGNADYLVSSLGIRVDNTPPYRADLKGIIEQHFAIINRKIKPYVPGAVESELRERGEQDYRLNSRLTLKDFTKIIITSILRHNREKVKNYPLESQMVADKVPPIPIELWNWGIVKRSGWLHEKPRDLVRLSLMPRGDGSMTRQGLYFNKMYYACEEALVKGWYDQAARARFKVQVIYDPRNSDTIYIPSKDGSEFITCRLVGHYDRFFDMSIHEVEDQLYSERVMDTRLKTSQEQLTAESNATVKHIIREAEERTEALIDHNQSKSEKVKNIRTNRRLEREELRTEQAWVLGEKASAESEMAKADVVVFSPSNNRAGADAVCNGEESLLQMLKKQRDARRNKV